MVENLDQNVGRLTNFLKDQDLEENTVVMFIADHGNGLGHRPSC